MTNKLREPINSITHLAGALLSFIALIAMLAKVIITNPTFTSILSVTIFGICLMLLYTVSSKARPLNDFCFNSWILCSILFNFIKKFHWPTNAFNNVYHCNNWYNI